MSLLTCVQCRYALVLLIASVIAGCSFNQQTASPATYVLAATLDEIPKRKSRTGRGVLSLATPRAEAAFDTTAIPYTKAPLALSYYRDSRWADTPARMLEPLLARTLELTGVYRAVVSQPSLVAATHQLEINLVALQQEFFTQPSQVRLVLRASLIDSERNRVIANQRFEVVRPAASEDAYGGVQAASAALDQVLRELAEFVIKQAR